jgi:hypothetical protein
MRRLFLAATSLLAASSLLLPRSGSAATGNLLLARGRTEPVVAVDPRHPSIVVAGSNTNYSAPVAGTYPTAYYYSRDGGSSFAFGTVPQARPFTTGADPTVSIAQNGTVYFSYLGETPAYCSGGRGAVVVTSSHDSGRTFGTPRVVDVDSADDKPSMAVESLSHDRTHLFLTWTRWHNASSDIWFSRSLDGGHTFSRPVILYSSAQDNFGSVPVVGLHGRIYVFWSTFPDYGLSSVTPTQIIMRVSADDGGHFSAARGVGSAFTAIPRMAAPGSLRNLTGPTATIDRHGAVYVAWAAVTHRHPDGSMDADILLRRSSNGGASWSQPLRVNDVSRGDRFMPSLTLLSDGSLGVAFYDRRRSWYNLDIYAARLEYRGGFEVSPNVRVNQSTSPIGDIYYITPGSTCFSPGRFFGDYIGTAAGAGGQLCVVWADTQLHVSQETDLWFAKVHLPASLPERHGGRRLTGTKAGPRAMSQRRVSGVQAAMIEGRYLLSTRS